MSSRTLCKTVIIEFRFCFTHASLLFRNQGCSVGWIAKDLIPDFYSANNFDICGYERNISMMFG